MMRPQQLGYGCLEVRATHVPSYACHGSPIRLGDALFRMAVILIVEVSHLTLYIVLVTRRSSFILHSVVDRVGVV